MVRAVIDTNVLVSALIHDGKPRKLILELLNKHTVILSRQMLAELADVAGRDKFNITGSQVERFLSIMVKMAKIVPDNTLFKEVAFDPDDDVVLNAAYTGKADYIVTGDKHLLTLNNFKKTKIVTVNQMLEILTMQ
jgi:putative PIN family toxin of toxin-antitoxin system